MSKELERWGVCATKMVLFFPLLFLLIINLVESHNWVDNPTSRANGGLSKTAPCPARKSKLYHNIMVGPGQTFNIQVRLLAPSQTPTLHTLYS